MAEPAEAPGAELEALIQLQHSSWYQENFLNICISPISSIQLHSETNQKKKQKKTKNHFLVICKINQFGQDETLQLEETGCPNPNSSAPHYT